MTRQSLASRILLAFSIGRSLPIAAICPFVIPTSPAQVSVAVTIVPLGMMVSNRMLPPGRASVRSVCILGHAGEEGQATVCGDAIMEREIRSGARRRLLPPKGAFQGGRGRDVAPLSKKREVRTCLFARRPPDCRRNSTKRISLISRRG